MLALACSRTELDVQPDPRVESSHAVRIALFGSPGLEDESELLQFLSTYGSVTRTQIDGAPLTSRVLTGFDVVLLDQLVREYSSVEATAFVSWIGSGGAVLSLTGYVNAPSDWTRPNSLLSQLDAVYESGLIVAGPAPQVVSSFEPHPLGAARQYGSGRVYMWGDEWVEYTSSFESSPDTRRFWTNAMAWLHG